MKYQVLLLLTLIFVVASMVIAREPMPVNGEAGEPVNDVTLVDNTTYLDGNSILMFVTNHGNFGRDLFDVFGRDYGTYFPYRGTASIYDGSLVSSPLYAAGLWVGGKVNGQTRVTVAEYNDEFVPGPMENGTYQPDNNLFKVYKLYRDSLAGNPDSDYLNWPVDQGAPVDSLGQPLMRGKQMLWTVYNDADPSQHSNDAGGDTDRSG